MTTSVTLAPDGSAWRFPLDSRSMAMLAVEGARRGAEAYRGIPPAEIERVAQMLRSLNIHTETKRAADRACQSALEHQAASARPN